MGQGGAREFDRPCGCIACRRGSRTATRAGCGRRHRRPHAVRTVAARPGDRRPSRHRCVTPTSGGAGRVDPAAQRPGLPGAGSGRAVGPERRHGQPVGRRLHQRGAHACLADAQARPLHRCRARPRRPSVVRCARPRPGRRCTASPARREPAGNDTKPAPACAAQGQLRRRGRRGRCGRHGWRRTAGRTRGTGRRRGPRVRRAA